MAFSEAEREILKLPISLEANARTKWIYENPFVSQKGLIFVPIVKKKANVNRGIKRDPLLAASAIRADLL